jgi:hypothetical protein
MTRKSIELFRNGGDNVVGDIFVRRQEARVDEHLFVVNDAGQFERDQRRSGV